MGYIDVIAAAIGAFVFGALYYGALSRQWIEASGVTLDPDTGRPSNSSNPIPYLVSFVMILLVAGFMRHFFVVGNVETLWNGTLWGLGIGLFFIAPWITLNCGYSGRPWRLAAIDSGYAIAGGGIIGLILRLLA